MPEIDLHEYQKLARDFLIKTPKAGLFLDVGFGKTLTTLSALSKMPLRGHILIIAPKAIARSTWLDELKKWGFNVSTVSLIVNERGKNLTKAKRIALYEEIKGHKPSIYFINRELICDLIEWHTKNRFDRRTRKIDWPFPNIVIDELQSFKSASSQRFKALKKVMPYVDRFIGLTGTPVPNGLMDLWSEIWLMDGGKRLGTTLTQYRDAFFRPGYTLPNGVVTEWIPRAGMEAVIYDRIKDIVISVKNADLKLPKLINNNVYCDMDDKEMAVYKKLMKEQLLETKSGKTVEASNSAVLSVRLTQMASGTIYTTENDAKHLDYIRIHTRKLERLKYIIENTGDNILIAYHFRSDEKEITDYLDQNGIAVRKLDGSPEMIKEWNDGKIPVMLIQPKSFAHGINIQQGGHTLVWYTIPTSLEEYIQTVGRLKRQGQSSSTVFVHHLITRHTIDTKLLSSIEKKDLSERELLNAVNAVLNDDEDDDF